MGEGLTMSDVLIRRAEGCDPDSYALWDSVWQPAEGAADWALAGSADAGNAGGLRAREGLATAVVLALFTDKRVPVDHPLAWLADGDQRGWWGDGIDVRADLGETELGSHLWLLERAPLTIRNLSVTHWARQFAIEALAPLQRQGAFVRMDVTASADELRNRLDLTVNLFGRDGAQVYDRKFDLIWNQVAR